MCLFLPQGYKALTDKPDCRPDVWVYLACTLFFLGLYKEAEEASRKGTSFTLFPILTFCCFITKGDIKN